MNKYGLKAKQIVINNVVKSGESGFLQIKVRQQKKYLKHIHEKYSRMKIIELPMFPREVKGLKRLQNVEKVLFS
jgi:anion-transporting  ArsA/GET3 family ATPase